MLSIQDMIDYCDLDCGEIEAVAEHEHLPMAVAAELSEALLVSNEGVVRLHMMVLEDLERALECGRLEHAEDLARVYQHLQRAHPLPHH